MSWLFIWSLIISSALGDYLGCYKDGSPRDLFQRLRNPNVSVSTCVSGCLEQEYAYAAVQYSYLCFCGDHYGRFGKLPDEMCDSACKHSDDQYCGGDWKNSIYATGFKGKKKKIRKRDQIVLFDEPKEIKISGAHKLELEEDNLPAEYPRSDIPVPQDHVINPTDYNQDNQPGTPGESISAFPLATNPPPLEETAGQTQHYPLEENSAQQISVSQPSPTETEQGPNSAPSGATVVALPEIHVTHGQSDPITTDNQNGQTTSTDDQDGQIITIDNEDGQTTSTDDQNGQTTSTDDQNGQTTSTDDQDEHQTTDVGPEKDTSVVVIEAIKNTTIVKINGKLYHINGTLTNVTSEHNDIVTGMLHDVSNGTEHVINETQAGVTTEEGDGDVYSYDGASSTTVSDEPVPVKVHHHNALLKHGDKHKKKLSSKSKPSRKKATALPHYPALSPPTTTAKATAPIPSLHTSVSVPKIPSFLQPSVSLPQEATTNEALAAGPLALHDTTSKKTIKKLTACDIEHKMAVKMEDSFVPDCQEDGSYAPVQCFSHSGFGRQCWCVDDKGQEVGDTRTMDGTTPTCEKVPQNQPKIPAEKPTQSNYNNFPMSQEQDVPVQLSQCQAERKLSAGHKDMFSPKCLPNGSYYPVQCYEHALYGKRCWCVNGDGNEVLGTSSEGDHKPDCRKKGEKIALNRFKAIEKCLRSSFGCCADGKSLATGPANQGCPETTSHRPECLTSKYGCCPGTREAARGRNGEGCGPSCKVSKYGCCPDRKTPAKGRNSTGCPKVSKKRTKKQPNCFETKCGCCPDGVTIALGPKHQGCGIKKPVVPKAKDVCASLVLKQVWFDELQNPYSPTFQQFALNLRGAITKIYSVEDDFGRVAITGFQPGCSPHGPDNEQSVIVYFSLHFVKPVGRPLKPLQEHIEHIKSLAGRSVFTNSLMLIGTGSAPQSCRPLKPTSPLTPPLTPTLPPPTKPTTHPTPQHPTRPTQQPLVPTIPPPPNQPPTPTLPPPTQSTSLPPPTQQPPSKTPKLKKPPKWKNISMYISFDDHKFPYVTDISGHNNPGHMSPGVNVIGVQMGCGLAGSFIGGSIVVDGEKFRPKPRQAVTIAMWVKFRSVQGEQVLFSTSPAHSYDNNYYLLATAGQITWCHKTKKNKTFDVNSGDVTITAGQWSHLAVTYSSTSGKAVIYIDAKKVGTAKGSGDLTQDWSGITEIGSCNGHYPFYGVLDDFVIYTVALNMKTIKKLACTCYMESGHYYSSSNLPITEQCHRGPTTPTKATSKITPTLPPTVTPTPPPTTPLPTVLPTPPPIFPPTTPPPTLPPPTSRSGPVNGGFADWTPWTKCSSTCGGGMQERTRSCTNPTPGEGGKDCTKLGAAFETRPCNTQPCAVDGGYTEWSTFTTCTKTCGGGEQSRTRNCTNPAPQFGGKNCSHFGEPDELRKCNTFFCPINGDYDEWSPWERCSKLCGGGKQFRSRTCTNPPAQYGGMNCDSQGPPREEKICNTNLCPVDGGYSSFGNWSACSATCGGGNQTRARACTNPAPGMGGKNCSQYGPPVEVMKCNEQKCPIDGSFTSFGKFSECSATCGGGIQSRMRTCTNPTPQYLGKNCEGPLVETKMCNVQPCPVDNVAGFSKWSECSVSCGRGVRSRSSVCGTDPSCTVKTETESCNTQPCPIAGTYSSWSKWSKCSSSCGFGVQQQTRACNNPLPQHGGMGCEVLGPSVKMRNCSLKECPVEGGYSDWTFWSACSATCGGGMKTRFRNCTAPAPAFGGKDCSDLGPESETLSCNPDRCPVGGGYTTWGEWSNCTSPCGGGEQVRTRTCTNPVPEFGGNDCSMIGESFEKRECHTAPCPVSGGYTMWSNWTECSTTCGEGIQYRERHCSNPAPKFGGSDCLVTGPASEKRPCFLTKCPESYNETEYIEWSECSKTCGMGVQSRTSKNGEESQSRFCNTQQCPVDGGYSLWSNWTECTASCGGGVAIRRRSCTYPEPQYDGKDCVSAIGPDTEAKKCNVKKCPVPKVPIRSCLEYFKRCHTRVDGLYTIYTSDGGERKMYCDMTKDGGGWTLLVTSESGKGWNSDNVMLRNEEQPSLFSDYSVLKFADGIKGISTGGFEYRLESSERGSNGGIWKAPQQYSFIRKDSSQTKILDVSKFGSWDYGKTSLERRMPWLSSTQDGNALLTTSSSGKEKFGSVVNKDGSPSWIKNADPNPPFIWYWVRESPGQIYTKDPAKKDMMCAEAVDGGYSEWSVWAQCTKTCGGGSQLRTRSCTSPIPMDGGLDCSDLGIGGDEETKQCNAAVCPGQQVDGGYSDWSPWTECTATCGGGSRIRRRACSNPAPANDGKTCFDQQLGPETESEACNIQQCEGLCEPVCQNGGQCVGTACQCTEMYEGKSCGKAICKKACLNNGICLDPFKNVCQCRKGFCGNLCEKSGKACVMFVFFIRLTNLARKDILLFSNDGIPKKGFPIKGRQIVEISKTTMSNNPVTFQVQSGNNLLYINKKQAVTLMPTKTKGQPVSFTVSDPTPPKLYFAFLRVTNLAKANIVLKTSDNAPTNGFNIKSNVIAEITKKTGSSQSLTFQAFDQGTSKVLFVNGKQSFVVRPTEVKGPPIALIVKQQAAPAQAFYIVLQLTNLVGNDIILIPGDQRPAGGIKVNKNMIVKIKKIISSANPVMFTAVNAKTKKPVYINDAKTISITPQKTQDSLESLIVSRTAKEVVSDKYYILLQVINKSPHKVVVIPSDNEPATGFALEPLTISNIYKTVHAKQAIAFTAIEAESNADVLLNGKTNVTLVPWLDTNHTEVVVATAEAAKGKTTDVAEPSIRPYYFWSFLAISSGKIPGHPPLVVHGHVSVVNDGGLYFDGTSGYLSAHLSTNDVMVNPGKASQGLAFGIKFKFASGAKDFDTVRYIVDTGALGSRRTGVTLYVMNGKIVAELATQNLKWKVQCDLVYDKWLYVIVNWKASQGLQLALNGFKTAETVTGSQVSGLLPLDKDNLCFGKNVAGTGDYFTKFYLASFVVFNQYLPPNLVLSVYTYYWVNVLIQPSKLYFANLKIANKLKGPISLKFSDNFPANGFLLKSNSIANIKKKTSNPTAISIHAEDPISQKLLYVNGLPNYRVTPSAFEEQVTDLSVSSKSGIEGTQLFRGVGCYQDKRNPRPLPELLHNFRGNNFDWLNYNKTIMKCALLAKQKNYRLFGLQFYGECWSGPSVASSYSKDGSSLECDKGVGKANTLFVYRFSDGAIVPRSMFYLAADIHNKYGKQILLKSSDNQPSEQLVPINGLLQLTKDIPNQTPVEFEAFDATQPGKRLAVNNMQQVTITPSTVKGAPHVLVVTEATNAAGVQNIKSPISGSSVSQDGVGILTKPWFIHVLVHNKVGKDVILLPGDNDPPQGFKIPARFVSKATKTLSSKQVVTFRAIEQGSGAKVLLNNKEFLEVASAQGNLPFKNVVLTAFSGGAVSTEDTKEVVNVEAPPVTAFHSWLFTSMVNKQIPGDTPLSVHGNTVIRNGATLFDGSSSWLGVTLSLKDCLVAPSFCNDGFSLTFKIFLDPSAVGQPAERYIFDTGALSKGTRGFSVYLQSGRMFCVVMTASGNWKVSMVAVTNQWIYVGISWSELQGLYFFINGQLQAETKLSLPQVQMTPINQGSPNLVFGRSMAQGGFAKFYLASFATFKTFMSQAVMRSVFTFYWRAGTSQKTSKVGYIHLRISNQAGMDIRLFTSDKVPANGFLLAKGFIMDFEKELYGVFGVTMTASDPAGGKKIYLNGKTKLELKASGFKGDGLSITASTSSNIGKGGFSRYYFVLKVANRVGTDIVLKSSDNTPHRGFPVKKNFIVMITKFSNSVMDVRFTANDGHGNPVLLNGRRELVIHPSTSKDKPVHEVIVNKMKAVGANKYYLTVKLLNKAGADVTLKSSDGNPTAGFKIKAGLAVKVTKTVATMQPVQFTAIDGKGMSILLNNKPNIILKPSPMKGNSFTMSATPAPGSKAMNVYFTYLQITNRNPGNIVLKSSDNYPKNGYVIKQKTIAKIMKKSSSNIAVKYWVVDGHSNKPLAINGHGSITLTPHLIKSSSPMHLNIDSTAVKGSKKTEVPAIGLPANAQPRSSLPIYYLVLKLANRAGYDVTIIPDDSQPPQFQVRKGYLEIVTKRSHSNKGVMFRAIKSGTNEPLSINNKDTITLVPSSTKGKPVYLNLRTKGNNIDETKLKPESKTPSYLNLHVSNKYPGETIFFPEKESPDTGFHLNAGTAMNIHETVKDSSALTYVALGASNQKHLLLNNQRRLMVKPSKTKSATTSVEINSDEGSTLQTKIPQKDCHLVDCAHYVPPKIVDEYYITLLLHNKLGRTVRVQPSKGRRGGYVVQPYSFMKVNIIVKDDQDQPEPIRFTAEDLETQSPLLLNKNLLPISLTPSDSPDTLTNISISAEPPRAKPLQSWSFSAFDGSIIPGSPKLSIHGGTTAVKDALHLDGSTASIDTSIQDTNCLHDPEKCPQGLAFGTKLRLDKAVNDYAEPHYILDTGGHGDDTRGVALFVENKKLVAEVTTKNMRYRAATPLLLDQWSYVIATFKKGLGLSLYIDAQLRSMDNTGNPVPETKPIDISKNLLIGRNIRGPPYNYAAFDMASLTVFRDYLDEADVRRAYLFFWGSKSAKIYYATLRIINGAGRAAILKPDKGNPSGFAIKPNSTEEILLLSMSTDKNPIEAVKFHAIDAETSTKLMINHFIRPFVVVPKETKKDITTILITAPAPSIFPKYIWSFRQVTTGVVKDSNPELFVHGSYEPDGDSLRLLPENTWIDAGDYKGACLSDPQMCDEGMAMAMKFKFNDEAKNYTDDDPRFLLDTGAHDSESRGFTLYYQDRRLHCKVAISNAEWKASAPVSLHKWQYVIFTWKSNEGLSLYINGRLQDHMKHQINKPKLHHTDKFTRFEVARNIAGPPYGYAQFSINSLALFEEYLTKAEALREYIYYWGGGIPAFSDRYIKVRLDNKAGTNVKIAPSRGGTVDQGYTIKPHMSLELSFVAKGPSANVPVTFRAQDEMTNDALLINSSEEPFAVNPSDSSTEMTVATVTSSIKCLSPNGKFSDPTNEYGYINCTAGSAKRVACDLGMKWVDETKSCERKGGLPSLYYATLQLHNNVGKDIELVESDGKEPAHLLTKGDIRKIKLIAGVAKHYKFEAIDNSTGRTMFLNNQPFTTLALSNDPDKVTEIIISKPSHYYMVTTHTGVQQNAGTDANVFVKLIGDQGRTEELPLKHVGTKEFKPGQIDTFRVPALDIGKIHRVNIKHDGSGKSPSWYLNKVVVKGEDQRKYEFPFYDWLRNNEGEPGHVQKQLLVYHGKRTCIPSCKNGGECVEGKCQCPNTFEGESCEKALCPVPCKNGGKCVNPIMNECRCLRGYQGQYCENAICTFRCLNGGLCIGPNRCSCLPAYSGLRCEISSCKPDCINNGRCHNGKCQCASSYSGDHCQIEHICELSLANGPCLHELRKEMKGSKAEERSLGCNHYLTEILNNCHSRKSSYSQAQCEKQCDPTTNSVCSRIWNPATCPTDNKKFRFNAQTRTCEQFMFSGCLGNNNNFVDEKACNEACGLNGSRRKRRWRQTLLRGN